jgi:hypothetical protein
MEDPSFPSVVKIYTARLEEATECPAILEPWGKDTRVYPKDSGLTL